MKVFFRLVIANFKETLRDVMLLFWFLLFPIVFALIFGFLFSSIGLGGNDNNQANNGTSDGKNNTQIASIIFNVGIVSDNNDPLNKALEDQIKSISMFKVYVGTYNDEIKEYKSGKRNIVIVLPKELSKAIENQKVIDIPVYYDYQGASVLYGISEILNGMERNVTSRPQLFSIKLHNELTDNVDSTKSNEQSETKSGDKSQNVIKAPKQIDYTLPGVLAITLMQLGLFGSLRVISLRSQKTLKSLGATPLPRGMFLASEITVRLILSLIQALIIIVIGHFIFGLTISSNWVYIFGWVILGVTTFVSIGYMLTTFAKTVDSGNALMQVIQFPMMFLSGIFIPPEQMPDFLRPVVNAIPLTYLADGFRNVMTGVTSTYGMTTNFVILASIIIVSLVVAIYRFRWE